LSEEKRISVLVDGGEASAGPPLGPMLGPMGVNIGAVVNKINELTKEYKGLKIPVTVIVNPETKEFKVEVGTPPTSALLVKEADIEKGSSNPREEKVGNLTIQQVIKIAKLKKDSMNTKDLKAAVKQVLGTCVSLGVTVEGEDPRKVTERINRGEYDEILGGE